jgi:hypothetical protein
VIICSTSWAESPSASVWICTVTGANSGSASTLACGSCHTPSAATAIARAATALGRVRLLSTSQCNISSLPRTKSNMAAPVATRWRTARYRWVPERLA